MKRKRALAVGGVTGALVLGAGVPAALAYLSAQTGGTAVVANADSLPAGQQPTVTVSYSGGQATATVSFSRSKTTSGRDVTSFVIKRYTSLTDQNPTTFTCGVTGVDPVSCTDTNVPAGTYYYTDTPAWGTNWRGVESAKSSVVSSDNTAPSVGVTYDKATTNGWFNAAPVKVTLTATDAGSGPKSVTYSLDGGTATTVHSASISVSVSGDGTHTLTYTATDNAGNTSTSQSATVKIDTVAPTAPAPQLNGNS
ncbi:MAG: OmpL47-type beta-barrel domain-containing protein [Jatrophihabitans sp.]|uniref:OmpL47-type beta-barrel domain-containing protein n=1 Tax=Jatrophihabitans sp. TaxID=1932789 RepID=UPI003F7D9B0D